MKNRGYVNNACKNSIIDTFHLTQINKLKPSLFYRTLQYLCERTQKLIEKTNKQQQSIFQSFDCRTKKKPRIDVDSDIEISDDEEHEQ